MLKIYLIGFSLSLIAANPIVQSIPIPIQGQTCPAPTCSTCPAACPNMSRPTPCQTCQNPYRNLFPSPTLALRQPNCPCSKPVTVQNAVANQPINQEVLTELILRKLLSPPPEPVPSRVKASSKYEEESKSSPNVINNYIILPPEYFNGNASKVRVPDTRVDRTRKGRRRRKQRQRNDDVGAACPCDEEDKLNHNDENGNSRHETSYCQCDKNNASKIIASPEKNISQVKIETSGDNIVPTINDIDLRSTNILQNDKNNGDISRKTPYIEPPPVDIEKPRRKNRIRTKSIEEAIIRDFCKRHPTIPEEVARSLLRNLKKHIERHGNLPNSPFFSPLSDHRDHYSPIVYPDHEQQERVQNRRGKSNRGSRRRRPHRSGRRNKKPREELEKVPDVCYKKCDNLVEVNPAVINIETETITTEKITATTEKAPYDTLSINEPEVQVESPDDLIDQLEDIKEKFAKLNEIETTTVNYNKHIERFPELGKEDKVPVVYDNGVDDYYPDFRGDNIEFYASEEECDIKKEKYHYATEKHVESDSERYVTKEEPSMNSKNSVINNSNIDENDSECSVLIPPDSDENYEDSIKDSEETHFIPPPHLELPDFETKPVNRFTQDINEKFVPDDYHTASPNAEELPEIEMKPAKVFTKDKTGRTNVETMYGHSKVIRYGSDSLGAASEPVITYYLPEEAMTEDRIQLPDSEAAIVVAKSIHDLVDGWESM